MEEAHMSPDIPELKGRMMDEAEVAIDRLLARLSTKEELMLSDIEHSVRAAGQRIMRDLTQELVDAEAKAERGQRYVCPKCGKLMDSKGLKPHRLATDTGEVKLKRGYHYCPECRKGLFPPGSTVEAERDAVQPRAGTADGMGQ